MLNYYHQSQKPQKQRQLNLAQIIYIGELPQGVDQYELDQHIHSLGNFDIESLTVKPTKENNAYAYVKFKNKAQAEEALKKIHLSTIKNHVIRAEPFKQKSITDQNQKDNTSNLFVKNLPKDTTPKDLYDLFIKFGNIISIKLKEKNNECLGYGYVNFEKIEDAQKAIENLNNYDFRGKSIFVSTFYSKNKRNNEDKSHLVTLKNLPENLTNNSSLKEFLEKYGQVNFCSVINSVNKPEVFQNQENLTSDLPEKEKIGLAIFENKEDAVAAIKEVNGKIIDSNMKPLIIFLSPITKDIMEKISRAKQEAFRAEYEGCNLVVKNLPKEINDKNLFEIFRKFGDIKTARVATEGMMKEIKDNNENVIDKEFVYESKGFGYVLYKNSNDAAKAMETLNNKIFEYNNIKIKAIIEYYDYSKSRNSLIQELNNPNTKVRKNNNPYPAQNFINSTGQPRKNNNKVPYNKFQNQNKAYNNPNFQNAHSNQTNIPFKGNRGEFNNSQNVYNQRNYNNMSGNFNQTNMNRMQQQYNQNNPRNDMNFTRSNNPNIANTQAQKININQMPQQNTTNNQSNINNMTPVAQEDNFDFFKTIDKILKRPNSDERMENLGELIFYFLIDFIPKYKLNDSQGKFDDTILCSKLTGILIHEDDDEILEIFSKAITNEYQRVQ